MDRKNISSIVETLFSVLPLFKMKLFRPDKYEETNNLSPSHLQVLFLLADTGRITISEIGEKLNISKPNMTPLIKTLLNENLIFKIRDKKDKRYINIDITPKGKKMIEEHKQIVARNLNRKLSQLSKKDLEILSTSLSGLKKVLTKLD